MTKVLEHSDGYFLILRHLNDTFVVEYWNVDRWDGVGQRFSTREAAEHKMRLMENRTAEPGSLVLSLERQAVADAIDMLDSLAGLLADSLELRVRETPAVQTINEIIDLLSGGADASEEANG